VRKNTAEDDGAGDRKAKIKSWGTVTIVTDITREMNNLTLPVWI
jgi:hypothetical protein